MTDVGCFGPMAGDRAGPREVAKRKRRALIVRRARKLAEARKVAAEVEQADKSAGLAGVVRQLARRERR